MDKILAFWGRTFCLLSITLSEAKHISMANQGQVVCPTRQTRAGRISESPFNMGGSTATQMSPYKF